MTHFDESLTKKIFNFLSKRQKYFNARTSEISHAVDI